MKLSKAVEMLEEDRGLVFMGVIKNGFFKGDYSILKCSPDGYIKIYNYKENGTPEKELRKEFNGMITIEREWKLMQKSVTWNDILACDENCKVDHPLINNSNFEEEILLQLQGFNSFDGVMYALSNNLNDEKLKEVIMNGKWYLEQ